MDWSHYPIPAMQLQARFGDRVVPVFGERPKSIWAMVADAASKNPDGEALVCGDRRLSWREVVQQSASVAAGLRNMGLGRAIESRCCLATASNSHSRCSRPPS
jgi:long-chain acyl-CoA synthetase